VQCILVPCFGFCKRFAKLHLFTVYSENIENHISEMMSHSASSTLSESPDNINKEDNHPHRDESETMVGELINFFASLQGLCLHYRV
jgi:hypothetical protein